MAGARKDDEDEARALHERLLAGDPLSTADLFFHFAPKLRRRLAAKFATTDPELIEEAISETLLDYFLRPERYDPSRRSLRGYLVMAAERDLLNLRDQNRRRQGRLHPVDPVELDAQSRKEWEEGDDIAASIVDDEAAAAIWSEAMAVARTDEERIVQRLRLEGERATVVYVAALGWDDLSPAEQRRRLYQIKDRLDQRWRRHGGRHG